MKNELRREFNGKTRPCPGEAHTNPFIDYCGCCMPRWGVIEEKDPVDLGVARAKRMAVLLGELTTEQRVEVEADVQTGLACVETRTKKVGRRSYGYTVARYL